MSPRQFPRLTSAHEHASRRKLSRRSPRRSRVATYSWAKADFQQRRAFPLACCYRSASGSGPANEGRLRDGDVTHGSRPSDVYKVQSSLSAEGHVLVGDAPPVLVRKGVSLAVHVFERTLYKQNDLAVFLQHQRMDGAGRFVNDVTGPRYPIVFEIAPSAAKCQPGDRPVMWVNPEIATSWPPQFRNPMASRGIGLDELHFTSTLPVREPRRIVRGNIYSASNARICIPGAFDRSVTLRG